MPTSMPTPPPSADGLGVPAMARRTVALLNALAQEAGSEHPPSPSAVAEVLREHGEPGPVELSAHDVEEMSAAAVSLREVFTADDVDLAASRLNRLLARSTGRLRLTSHAGTTPWHPHLDSADDAPWGEWFLASSCLALAVLIWDGRRPPGGHCASPGCPHVYLAHGSGPTTRRYCSRRCATRERVAAHRRARARR
ncbi:CGNR zinc finger domain-containing protein [Streptomyces monticola]|uniref:CGNR zinc finger domain-containing protein n=1 Tax=Streptomyces monticola TaxID=2666263 RepID=A0ABW2JED3_9ACTN